MNFLNRFFEKFNTFFFTNKDSREEENYLCVFLRIDTDFVYLATTQDFNNPKIFKPLLIPLSVLGRISDKFFKINNFMFEEFDISPDRIQVYHQKMSLAPLKNQLYYFAIVDISMHDLKELRERDSFGTFMNLPYPYISIHSEENFFFNILVKLVENETYISNTLHQKGEESERKVI